MKTFSHKLLLSLLFCFGISLLVDSKGSDTIPMPEYESKGFIRGERLTYDIKYGIITAGMASFEVRDTVVKVGGRPHYHVVATGRSNSFFDRIFKVRDYYQSIIDEQTMMPVVFTRDVREGSYTTHERLVFNHKQNIVRTEGKEIEVPDFIHDLLSAFYYARSVDFSKFEKNQVIKLSTFFDGEIFPIGAVIIGRENVNTSFGTFDCLVIKPLLIEGRVFRDQSDMTIYVTADKNQIPVLIESAVYVGRVRAELSNYQNLKYPMSAKVGK